jgi:hypothetical protein
MGAASAVPKPAMRTHTPMMLTTFPFSLAIDYLVSAVSAFDCSQCKKYRYPGDLPAIPTPVSLARNR